MRGYRFPSIASILLVLALIVVVFSMVLSKPDVGSDPHTTPAPPPAVQHQAPLK